MDRSQKRSSLSTSKIHSSPTEIFQHLQKWTLKRYKCIGSGVRSRCLLVGLPGTTRTRTTRGILSPSWPGRWKKFWGTGMSGPPFSPHCHHDCDGLKGLEDGQMDGTLSYTLSSQEPDARKDGNESLLWICAICFVMERESETVADDQAKNKKLR